MLMTTKREIVATDYYANGKIARTIERVEFPGGLVDQHEKYYSSSGIQHNCLVMPFYTERAQKRRIPSERHFTYN